MTVDVTGPMRIFVYVQLAGQTTKLRFAGDILPAITKLASSRKACDMTPFISLDFVSTLTGFTIYSKPRWVV